MLDPISARLASSCSKNGMSEAATPTSILALKSISSTSSVLRNEISPPQRVSIKPSTILFVESSFVLAGAHLLLGQVLKALLHEILGRLLRQDKVVL